jgi:autophagy-related protein 5
MAADNIQLEIWNGCIPIELRLAGSDISTFTHPDPILILASRMSYLPLIAKDAVEYLQSKAVEFCPDVWFVTDNGVILKSHLPFGVLYDLYGSTLSDHKPWSIIVHFQPPHEAAAGNDSLDRATVRYCERLYFHSLKQALHLLHGSSRAFSELSLEQQSDLWLSPASNRRKWDSFATVRTILMPRSPLETKHLPIRVVDINGMQRLRLVKAVNDEGMSRTLQQILLDELQLPYAAAAIDHEEADKNNPSTVVVIAQGIQVPLTAPLYELWRRLCHTDLVLYLLFIPISR